MVSGSVVVFAPPPLPRTLEAAVRDLTSARPATRAAAAADLARHGAAADEARARAVPLLEKALVDPVADVRAAAAVALADLRAEEALPALLLLVEDDAQGVRQMAIAALGEIGDVRAGPRLRRALADERPDVRYQAVIAYARVTADDDEVDCALAAAARDGDEAIRYIAVRVAEERLAAPGGRGRLPRLVSEAKARLADDATDVAVAAAVLLARAGDADARAIVAEVVATGAYRGRPPPKEDEREAVELAGELGLRDATSALERRAYGLARHVRDTCAFHAKVALARLGHPRAVGEIERDLASGRRELVEAAVVAAGRARVGALRDRIARLTRGAADPALVAEALARLDGTEGA